MPRDKLASSHPLAHLGDQALADGLASLAHGETHARLDRGGGDQLALDRDVVAGHRHLHRIPLGARHGHHLPSDVASAEVEDGHVAGHDRVAAAPLVLAGQVDVGLELGVRLGGARGADDLPAGDVVARHAAAQHADGVARRALGEVGVEHPDPSNDGLLCLLAPAQDLDLVALLHDALLHAAGGHRAAARDGEHVLDGQQEGLVGLALGEVDVLVHRVHELQDLVAPLVVAALGVGVRLHGLERLQRGALDERHVIAREAVLAQHLTGLQLDELQQLLVIHHVHLVHEADELGHAHLLREQDVLAGLGHGPVGRRDHEDAAVHLAGARDHVLDVVRVARAVHVAVVARRRLVLDVRGVDRDPAGPLLGGVVDLLVRLHLGVRARVELRAHHRDRRRQGRLAVVHVAHRAEVDVVLGAPRHRRGAGPPGGLARRGPQRKRGAGRG
mmetsp:Transcript_51778/g.118394  ORF Transcript_51778/g.118394 Transcript_51778/m.118394 type:complete len:445 (+) Transcript_51778:224-1558(+)